MAPPEAGVVYAEPGPIGAFTGEEKRVRGHVPGSPDSGAGGTCGLSVRSARPAGDDGFRPRAAT
ncbi:hypothetical protein KYY02_01805 [Streptomyces pimonensis]|uniref:Uncharacterized protein n=1 Tax=Streptomyces pimonensis TaxID=2860288 RepID=A0ABV4IWD4_9ACTN